ncbi:RNase H domain-containing protein [Trichonephila clavipes]|nr:RNase H domain-containing protein [Trichonephila clavipes]
MNKIQKTQPRRYIIGIIRCCRCVYSPNYGRQRYFRVSSKLKKYHSDDENEMNKAPFYLTSSEMRNIMKNGSKLNRRVGLACVIYEEVVENFTFQPRLRDECSVFQAELLCINLVVKLIQDSLRQGGTLNFLICTDSLFSLHCLLSLNSTEKLVVEVQSIQYYLDCDIHFSYVRGHSGNLGNDRADQLAKEATCQDINLLMYVPLSHWKHVARERTVSSWNTEFLASPKALWTKRFFPTICQRLTWPLRAGLSNGRLGRVPRDSNKLDLNRFFGYKFRSSSAKWASRSFAPMVRN